jgi:hypothetical protein
MDDAPPHIKQLQLDIWLAKPPEERRLTHEDNDALFAFRDELKKNKRQADTGETIAGQNTK